MGFVNLKCPSCGAEISLDDSKEYGFCTYCGTQVVQDKIVVEHRGTVKTDETEKYNNMMILAHQAYAANNMQEAYNYYTRLLEIKQSDYLPIFRKGLCAGYLADGLERKSEVISGIKRAATMEVPDNMKDNLSDEICALAISHRVKVPSEFYDAESCSRYVRSLYNTICFLDELYGTLFEYSEKTVIEYSRHVISLCDQVKPSYNYENGIKVVNGSSQKVYAKFSVSKDIVSNVSSIRNKFVNESNKFLSPEIDRIKADINEQKANIKNESSIIPFLHLIFCLPVFLVTLVLMLFIPKVAIIALIIEIVAYVIYCLIDKNGKAQDSYNLIYKKKKELSKLNKKIVK